VFSVGQHPGRSPGSAGSVRLGLERRRHRLACVRGWCRAGGTRRRFGRPSPPIGLERVPLGVFCRPASGAVAWQRRIHPSPNRAPANFDTSPIFRFLGQLSTQHDETNHLRGLAPPGPTRRDGSSRAHGRVTVGLSTSSGGVRGGASRRRGRRRDAEPTPPPSNGPAARRTAYGPRAGPLAVGPSCSTGPEWSALWSLRPLKDSRGGGGGGVGPRPAPAAGAPTLDWRRVE